MPQPVAPSFEQSRHAERCGRLQEEVNKQQSLILNRAKTAPESAYVNAAANSNIRDRMEKLSGREAPSTREARSTEPENMCFLDEEEIKYAKCPPGPYFGHNALNAPEREWRLREAICKAKIRGWVNSSKNTEPLDLEKWSNEHFKDRMYMTYESSLWPKPAYCSADTKTWWRMHHTDYPVFRPDAAPAQYSKTICDTYNMEFRKSWKVASMTFPDYLACEYAECNWQDGSVRDEDKARLVLTAVREPIARWISAAGELLERGVNHNCPSGPCTQDDGFVSGDGEGTTSDRLEYQTSWYGLVNRGYSSDVLHELVESLVSDTACNFHTYASEHVSTQSTFLTQNAGPAADITFVVRLENADEDLRKMSEAVRGISVAADDQCSLAPHNVAECKPGADSLPSATAIQDVLNSNDELMRKLCLIYAQDFICFEYDLPLACQGLF